MAPHRLAVATLVALSRKRPPTEAVLRQVGAYGVEAVLPVLVLGLLVGGVGVARASAVLGAVGGHALTDELLVLLVRDAGPLLAALLVLVRSGASVAIDIRSDPGDPGDAALVRVVGLQLSVLALYVFFSLAALFGGAIGGAVGLGGDLQMPGAGLAPLDLVLAAMRCLVFGAVIGLFSCGEGLAGRALTAAVRRTTLGSMAACLVLEGAFGVLA